jgi:TatA/E family protein of Tat protein translocase
MPVGAPELLIVLVILLLLFGATRLPKLGRSLGEAGRELKRGYESEDVRGPCPFCGGHVPTEARFCPNCSKESSSIIAERQRQASQTPRPPGGVDASAGGF